MAKDNKHAYLAEGCSWTGMRTSVLRAALGNATFAGICFGLVRGNAQARLRVVRAQAYADQLAHILESIDGPTLHMQLQEMPAFRLFEEGARQFVQTDANDRSRLIIDLVADGLLGSSRDRTEASRILGELSSFDDDLFRTLRSQLGCLQDSYAMQPNHGQSVFFEGKMLELSRAIALARSTQT